MADELATPLETAVLVLEDNPDTRSAIAMVLREALGVQPVEACSFDDLVRQRARVLSCFLAILDVNLGSNQKSGIDAYQWLRQQDFRGRIVFLTGHAANHPLVEQVHALGGAQVLAKPIGLEQLRAVVEGARGGNPAATRPNTR